MRITVLALSVGLVVGSASAAQAAPDTASPPAQLSVTLITGDQVLLAGNDVVSYRPGPGRKPFFVSTYREKGHTFVVPSDAAPLVARGTLDRRLFDVTTLVDFGYDDARLNTTPLIVKQPSGALRAAGESLGLASVRAEKSQAAATWETIKNGGAQQVWLDGLRRPVLDRSVAQIGAPAAWQAGFTGKGVKVAVLDTGIDATHPDLVGRVAAEKNFTEAPDINDTVGHGTHVAATIASNGTKYRGVAPDAQLLVGKVCEDSGCSESAILAGMQWAAEQGADVVNLSLGGPDDPGIDPLEDAVNKLSEQTGTLFVIAAGNSGRPETIGSPGTAAAALTVGAVNRDDSIASFSSRGPTYGDGSVKPDVTAPGVDIVAAKAKDGVIGTPAGDGYVSMSGTSMATPHVAGAVALLKQQHPDWKGGRLKSTLMASAKPNPALTPFDQGTGRIDVAKALTQALTAEPGNLSLGVQQWPHQDDPKIVREITYRNGGTAPVSLDLSIDVKAPAGMFTITPAKLTVPAGGEAKATVTADTTVQAPDGGYVGSVVAGSLRTPISVNREVESYDVTVKHIDADGKPAAQYGTALINVETGRQAGFYAGDGGKPQRVAKGEYFISSGIQTGDQALAMLVYPKLVVSGSTEVVLDARQAKKVAVSVPDKAAKSVLSTAEFSRWHGDKSFNYGYLFFDGFGEGVSIAGLGPDSPEFRSSVTQQMEGTPRAPATPVSYRLAWFKEGNAPTGFVRAVKQNDLAEVRTGFVPGPEGRRYSLGVMPIGPDGLGGWAWLPEVPASGAVDYVIADGARWSWLFDQARPDGRREISTRSDGKSYKPKRAYDQRLNIAVHGPALPSKPEFAVARLGDQIAARVPMFGDGTGSVGDSAFTSAHTVLTKDGTKVGETAYPAYGQFAVPAGDGAYRLETEVTTDVSELSTKVSAAWTFRSSHVDALKQLPLSVLRFAPKLSDKDSTRVGLLAVPLVVAQQEGTPRVRKVEVEASFDDGKTWRRVPVVGDTALVFNERPGFASLRAKTVDAAGNTSEVAVIKAYRVTG